MIIIAQYHVRHVHVHAMYSVDVHPSVHPRFAGPMRVLRPGVLELTVA